MVAVINTGRSIHRSFNYNENKVKEGVAVCIGQGNYPVNADKMSLNMKLNRLLKRTGLNPNVKRNSVHISLNFDPSERLSEEKLKRIATAYMDKIGFGKQPYLVYQHHDSGHPHLHIVTTNIEADGNRIDLHHLGIRKSEPARKAIEMAFGLVVAGQQKKQEYTLDAVDARKVQYGKLATKKAIQNVLVNVLDRYRYSSLPQLNAILELYNVRADRGQETSRMYRYGGLQFRVLNLDGTPVGTPIKASLFYQKPTLKNLEKRFSKAKKQKDRHKLRLKNTITKVLQRQKGTTLEALVKNLEGQGIHTVIRKNAEGRLYGLTYIDHRTQTVFNGSELGKAYGAKAIQNRLGEGMAPEPNFLRHSAPRPGLGLPPQSAPAVAETKDVIQDTEQTITAKSSESLLETLVQPEQVSDYLPYHLKKYRKRKKKKKG
ncbi:relaxase/mobilization nuclease domain-containing protein [Sinomicrobium weinanense]|uniref:Relaxase/mobilization nuclease domain-containing protein n=1 Tax=Sinomicrobium weinanense TaxID=2842200 RepID=A0A926Q2X0_9FLAO|nr:relaxase/mobilization nuclease domain-containing protein [Sinomicrobium weinanense]MBC9795386.1 relaxase/mobilization nuclease domain-containing protein [Sinomicrobium weinanense]MBU3122899.1 relaxase/mobilization nuclease domain-containing protein [Sinomicrobium weinanense]